MVGERVRDKGRVHRPLPPPINSYLHIAGSDQGFKGSFAQLVMNITIYGAVMYSVCYFLF